jgi:hypothetical protein
MSMKMLLKDAIEVVDLCRRVRLATSEHERIELTAAIARSFHKLSEPMLFAAEDAVYFGMFGFERKGATPLEDLPKLISATADLYVRPQDLGSTSATEPPAQPQ